MAIVELLVKNHVTGMTNKELSKALEATEANICRDMALLEKRGWLQRGDKSRWRLSPFFGGFAGEIMKGFQTAKRLLEEEEARYASAMK